MKNLYTKEYIYLGIYILYRKTYTWKIIYTNKQGQFIFIIWLFASNIVLLNY